MLYNDRTKKHVYLVYTKDGTFKGYTFDKDSLKKFMKSRKGYVCSKAKYSKKLDNYLYDSYRISNIVDNVYCTESEGELIEEAFSEFLTSVTYSINNIFRLLKYVKMNDSDRRYLVKSLKLYMELYDRIMNSDESYDIYDKMYNITEVYRHSLREFFDE